MGPAAAAAIPAIISGVGGLIGGNQAQKASRREAAKNRAFQERMRDTAWQAAVADMKAAGVNPAVAYSKGPASAPGGSMASQDEYIGKSTTSAMQSLRVKKELELLNEQVNAASAQAQKTQSEKIYQDRINALWGVPGPQGFTGPMWKLHEAQSKQAIANARAAELSIPHMKNLAGIAGTEAGKFATWLQYILRGLPSGIGGKR